jgi:DNA primase
MARQGFTDALEAARSVAEKAGVTNNSWKNSKVTDSGHPKVKQDKDKAGEVRALAAESYHHELLSNEKALRYQVEVRGHSLDTLKVFQIGYAGPGSLISFIKQHGFETEDLIGIGLVRKRGNEYETVFRKGDYVYPHLVNGKISFFTRKNPDNAIKKYQVKKECAGEGWLCFNQDVLSSKEPIVIVEGENDCLSVFGKAGKREVIGVLGEFNSPKILAHLKASSKGKKYFLCFDRDEAGEKYEKRYTDAILSGGGEVRVIHVPPLTKTSTTSSEHLPPQARTFPS